MGKKKNKNDSVFGYVFKVATEGYGVVKFVDPEKELNIEGISTKPMPKTIEQIYEKHSPKANETGANFTEIFKKFSQLNTKESYVDFANNYGLLNSNQCRIDLGDKFIDFEPIIDWDSHVKNFRFIKSLYSICKSRNSTKIKGFIKKEPLGIRIIYDGIKTTKDGYYFSKTSNGHVFEKILKDKKDLFEIGLYIVQNEVNVNLFKHASPKLLWNDTKGAIERRLTLKIYANDLLGVIWMQFAKCVNLNNEFKVCVICNEPFEVGRGAATKRKNTCLNPECARAIQEKSRGTKNK